MQALTKKKESELGNEKNSYCRHFCKRDSKYLGNEVKICNKITETKQYNFDIVQECNNNRENEQYCKL